MNKFKKLRKIFRILFPLKITGNKGFINKLKSNNQIKEFSVKESIFEINTNQGNKIFSRDFNHSDYDVFKQIFNDEEYKIILSILKNNPKFINNKPSFIDAGANVGYTTMYFSYYFNFDTIICIEPSKENFKILEKNIATLENHNNISIYQNALTNKLNTTFTLDTSFRDHKDWSISTKESVLGDINGITINELIENHDLKEITLLKIDIEGAERFIFNKTNNLDFLKKVKILAIEIHDEFNIRDEINEIVKDNNFMIFESGELTIGINNKLI